MLVGLVQVAARTTTGTTDITVSGYGTCKGAIFWLTKATANGTAVDEAVWGYGATDGTNDRACSMSSEHNLSDTNTYKRAKTGKCVLLINQNTGNIDGEAQFSAFITDGIRINTTDAFAAGYLINCILFFGSDCQFAVGDFDTTSGNATVNTLSFRPKVVNVFGTRAAINDTSTANFGFSNGWCYDNNGTTVQGSMNTGEDDNSTVGAPYMRVETALVARDLQNGTVGGSQSLGSFGSSGFTATQGDSAGFPSMYAAFTCDNQLNWTGYITALTTGNTSRTQAGWRPMAVFGYLTRIRTPGANNQTGLAGSWGAFGFTSASNEFSSAIGIEDNGATTNTQSITDSIFFDMPDHVGSTAAGTGILGDINAILSNGFEVNFTSVDTSNFRVFGGLAVQEMVFTATTVTADAATVSFTMQKRAQTTMTVSAGAATTVISGKRVHQTPVISAPSQAGAATVSISAKHVRQTAVAVTAGAHTTAIPTQLVIQHRQAFCADFNGTDDYMFSDSVADWNFGPMIEVWFNADSKQDCGVYCVWDPGDDPTVSQFRLRFENKTLWVDFVDGQDFSVYTFDTGYEIELGIWVQVIVLQTIDGGGNQYARVIVSKQGSFALGTLIDFPLPTGFFPNPSGAVLNFFLGQNPVLGQYFDGRMMKVRNWTAAFSDAQLHDLYNYGAGLETNLTGALLLDSPFGSDVVAAAELNEYATGATQVDRAVQHTFFGPPTTLFDGNATPSGIRGWWVGAHDATAAITAQLIHRTTMTVSAGAATTAITGQRVHQTTTACAASGATTVFSAQKRMHVAMTVSAGAATTVTPTQIVHQTTTAVSAAAATVSISTNTLRQTSMTVSAGAATVSISASYIHQASVAASADPATTNVTAQLVHQTATTCSAGAATTVFSAQRRMHVTMAVSADTATVSTDADIVRQTTTAVSAGSATAAATAQRIVQTTVTCAAGAATVSISTTKYTQSSVSVSAGDATTAIAAQRIVQTTVTASAGNATTNIDGTVVNGAIETSMTVSAGAATTAIAAQLIHQSSLVLSAGSATTSIDADRVVQTTVTCSAGAATCAHDTDVVRQASTTVSAGNATTNATAQRLVQSSVAVSAGAATTNISAQRIVQTTVACSAGAATCSISATIEGVNAADVTVSAGAATTVTSTSVIRQTSMAASAGSATTAVAAKRVVQTSVAVSAGAATCNASGDVAQAFASVSVTAGAATTALQAVRVVQAAVALQAAPGSVSVDADLIRQTSVAVSAGAASVAVDADRVVQTAVACAAGAATCAVSGTTIQSSGSVTAQAGSATASVSGQVVHRTAVAVSAGNASTAIAAQRVHQTTVALQAAPATCVIAAGLNITGDIDLVAGRAVALIAGQRIVQTISMAVQARPARAIALEIVEPSMVGEPATLFQPLFIHTAVVPAVEGELLEPLSSRTSVVPDVEADLFFNLNFKQIAGAIAIQASPATASIQGTVL